MSRSGGTGETTTCVPLRAMGQPSESLLGPGLPLDAVAASVSPALNAARAARNCQTWATVAYSPSGHRLYSAADRLIDPVGQRC